MQVLRLFIVFILVSGSLTFGARAGVFDVDEVPIDARAQSVSDARKKAIRLGTTIAANQLIARLTLPQDRMASDLSTITGEVAEQWVRSIQINDERRSDKRYLGTLNVQFDPVRVRNFLDANGLVFVESQTANALVLPIWNGADGPLLWRKNPWWVTWDGGSSQNNLTPLTLPLADLGDRQAVNANKAIHIDTAALQQLAARYDVNKIIIAEAIVEGPGRVLVHVKTVKWDMDGQAIINQFQVVGAAPNSKYMKPAYQQARRALIVKIQDEWKKQAVVRSANLTTVHLTALYADVAHWRRIREALAKSPLVKEARLDAFSADGAMMTLVYMGTRDQLQAQLSQSGIEFLDTEIGPVAQLR